jgi:hypothetical protein
MNEENKLATIENVPIEVLRPVGTNEQIIQAWKDFQNLKAVLLVDEDFYTPAGGKPTVRKSGWRKMAVAFGLTDEIIEEKREYSMIEPGKWTWRIKVRVYSRGGRSTEGIGACSNKERKFAHEEHDTYAMAHTRAKSRAIADMLGAADQVAEEAPESDDPEHYEGTFKPKPKNAGPDGWTDEELKQALRDR